MPQRFEDLTGKRFGRLVAVRKYDGPTSDTRWVCICDCGNETKPFRASLKSGVSQSCGCLQKELASERGKSQKNRLKHGRKWTPEYGVWCAMRRRCDNPKVSRYENYGGRGIKVCERWHRFENFIADMGERPSTKHSIERRNNDGDYEPANCHWATMAEQSYNKSSTRLLAYNGEQITVKKASEVAGVPRNVIFRRLYTGWSVQDAIERPLRRW